MKRSSPVGKNMSLKTYTMNFAENTIKFCGLSLNVVIFQQQISNLSSPKKTINK
jgi:hypothetical protein